MPALPIPTNDTSVELPGCRSYLTRNPISQRLIRGFMGSVLDLAGSTAPTRILDVGCGVGMVLRQLRATSEELDLYGCDVRMDFLPTARQLAERSALFAGSIYQLPLPSRSYDLVICTEVLEHLDNPEQALSELRRVARRYCLVSVPNEPWWCWANMARGKFLRDWGNTPGHVNHWNERAFRSLVGRYLDVVAVRQPFPWTVILGRVTDTLD
jgi:2-polyprenyl-3-methyl-5-hydroxy-6-metoxy-1,4-benzoquinol methylase